jgi:hypothetical protein
MHSRGADAVASGERDFSPDVDVTIESLKPHRPLFG